MNRWLHNSYRNISTQVNPVLLPSSQWVMGGEAFIGVGGHTGDVASELSPLSVPYRSVSSIANYYICIGRSVLLQIAI